LKKESEKEEYGIDRKREKLEQIQKRMISGREYLL
jgi:hypothetical protein